MNNKDKIQQIESELNSLSEKRKDLLKQLRSLKSEHQPQKTYGRRIDFIETQTPEDRVSIFLKFFRCREDVFPKYWENQKSGKKGYPPSLFQ